MNKVEYSNLDELKNIPGGLNLLIDKDVVTLKSFNDEIFNEYKDDETDVYFGFYMSPNLRIYNKIYFQNQIHPDVFKGAYDLLPIVVYNNKGKELQFNAELKYYAWNHVLNKGDLKVKMIPKILGAIDIEWEEQQENRKKELEKKLI